MVNRSSARALRRRNEVPYDLSSLDDAEFEILCCRLLSLREGKHVEHFARGRDLGVDGRYFEAPDREAILQCKHWARSTFTLLLRSLRDQELGKVQKLAPARYFLATSLPLTRINKKTIASLFDGYVKSESDILGSEDIDDLLTEYPDVIRQFPAFWLRSADVLESIENAAVLGRSDFLLEEVAARAPRYVRTDAHERAMQKLELQGVVLITGLPGIGKTTLAEQLCLSYAVADYQLCVFGEFVEEIEKSFVKGKKQVFYLDDFLGRNYLEALGRHEDSRIVSFIRRVQSDASKRLIMTSRSTVLNEAKVISDQFEIAKVTRTELEIRVEQLSELDRARILHKHMWHSDLPAKILNSFTESRRYRTVIGHKNFNPRLIQFITDAHRTEARQPDKYWEYVSATLANPAAIWEHVYDGQLDDFCRVLLLLCCYHGQGQLSESELRDAFAAFKQHPVARNFKGSGDFVRTSKIVSGSVLTRLLGRDGDATYVLFNPSVADYVFRRAAGDKQLLCAVFTSLRSESALRTLDAQLQNKILERSVAASVVDALVDGEFTDDGRFEYELMLAELACRISDSTTLDAVCRFAKRHLASIDDDFRHWERFVSLLAGLLRRNLIEPVAVIHLFPIYLAWGPAFDETKAFCALFKLLPESLQVQVAGDLKRAALEVWENDIHDVAAQDGTFDQYMSEDDVDEAEDTAQAFVERILDEYPVSFTPDEVETLVRSIDVRDIIYSNQHRSTRPVDARVLQAPRPVTTTSEVDEIFNTVFPRRSK